MFDSLWEWRTLLWQIAQNRRQISMFGVYSDPVFNIVTHFFTFHRHSVRPNVWRGEGWSAWHWPSRRFPDESRQEQVPRTTGSCVGPIPRCSWAWGPTTTLPWLVFASMPFWKEWFLFLPSAWENNPGRCIKSLFCMPHPLVFCFVFSLFPRLLPGLV